MTIPAPFLRPAGILDFRQPVSPYWETEGYGVDFSLDEHHRLASDASDNPSWNH